MENEAANVLERRIRASLRERAYDDTAALLESLRALEPLSVRTRALELEHLVRAGRRAEAYALAAPLVPLFPASARVLYWAGRAAYAVRRYDEAASWLEESCRIAHSNHGERWRAKALTQLGRLDDAEPILLALAARGEPCRADLAWLYERRGDLVRAIAELELHVQVYPDDARARDNLLRLRAGTMDAESLVAEVAELTALGEPLPEAMRAPYLGALLSTARTAEARQLVSELYEFLDVRDATSLGFVCYRAQAWDLAYELLVRALPARASDVKHLNALEKAAAMAGRTVELAEVLHAHAAKHPSLHGRVRKLRAKRER